jgi:hypothetical protein
VAQDEQPDDDLLKIARYAAKKGLMSERSAVDMAAQARLHQGTGGPRGFLRKLLEIKGGLTYDEIARLEKEALAPPPPPPLTKRLPKLDEGGTGGSTFRGPEPVTISTPSRSLPRPFDAKKSDATPIVVSNETPAPQEPPAEPAPSPPVATPSRALPRLSAKTSGESPALTPDEGTIIEKKKLPSLGTKRIARPPEEKPAP